ncbi:phage distal tail protein [Streptomyces fractus]|uniref:phage distal tail protein n=1 Tax=Streptomyces fractus TaxID=641806 RepID=UPI003CFAA278
MDRTLVDVTDAAAGMRPGHIRFGPLLLGPGTPYRWTKLTGWEALPEVDSGDVPRPAAHGAWPGQLLSQSRTLTLENLIIRAPAAQFGAVMDALTAATALGEDEIPLLVSLDERGPLLSWARATKRDVPANVGYALGVVTEAALELTATDPRRYIPAVQTTVVGLPEPCLPWHRDHGHGPRGIPASTGDAVVRNLGGAPTHPVIELWGPVDTPRLVNETTGAVLEYELLLDPGERLTIDTFAGTAQLDSGEGLLTAASGASWPEPAFTLAPGRNEITFRSGDTSPDPRAAAALRWRSAHW